MTGNTQQNREEGGGSESLEHGCRVVCNNGSRSRSIGGSSRSIGRSSRSIGRSRSRSRRDDEGVDERFSRDRTEGERMRGLSGGSSVNAC